MSRTFPAEVQITNPKAMFTVGHIGATANSFLPINSYVTGAGSAGSDITLNDGVLVKNIGPNTVKVTYDPLDHGAAEGFNLTELDQILIETNSISSVLVKNNIGSQGITFSIYANWGKIWQ